MGLWEGFVGMPRPVQEVMLQFKGPEPALVFAEGFPLERKDQVHLEQRFREAAFEAEGRTMRVRDFFAIVMGCMTLTSAPFQRTSAHAGVRRFMEAANPTLEGFYNAHFGAAVGAMKQAVFIRLVGYTQMDTRLLTLKLDFTPQPNGKLMPRLTVGSAPPRSRSVTLDGRPRTAYRVGQTAGDGIEWVRWAADWTTPGAGRRGAERVKIEGEVEGTTTEGLGVYVQSHALRQLHARVNAPSAGPWLESWLATSLAEPNVIERQAGGDLLVEYRIREHRLGYLVVTPLAAEGAVVVRTFLFLTMEPTPESRLLRRELRLTRREADWLGLHDLSAFLQTDLRHDPVLRPMLQACGCGHLFELGDAAIYAPQPKAFAAEMRKYLRLAA